MCGIVGYIGPREAYPIIITGLKRQEYRGYDSTGVALINDSGLHVYKKKGKVAELEQSLIGKSVNAHIGIGHTRWATHGEPSDENAHPHQSNNGKLAMIHNGIIENLETKIANLTLQNDSLKTDKVNLIADKQVLTRNLDSTNIVKKSLEEKVDVASTLNASNISITPLKIKSNGTEKVKTSAKQVDKLLVRFDVRNRIIQSGSTNIYVIVIGPDGLPIKSAGTESFNTREDGEKYYTAMLPVNLETSTTKSVEFSFAPIDHFKEGNYKVQIYQNGFLIGEGNRELTKGGLFG
jgi:predicted glutamine amidotransferase